MRVSDVPMPPPIAALPRNAAGYPIPWFVAVIDGVADFRVIEVGKMRDALRFKLCFTCGRPMGVYGTFVIGPMCAVNRVSAEPPSHADCAEYSARACPFLSTPNMVRRANRLPENRSEPAGVTLRRNPGVALAWTSRTWKVITIAGDPARGLLPGALFDVGEPTATHWFSQGRDATRAEVEASIESGLPSLRDAADQDGPEARAAMEAELTAALALLPAW